MARPQLRVHLGSDCSHDLSSSFDEPTKCPDVTVTLADVLPLLADAVQMRRAWVQDFMQDQITLSADLYGVLMAYQDLRKTG